MPLTSTPPVEAREAELPTAEREAQIREAHETYRREEMLAGTITFGVVDDLLALLDAARKSTAAQVAEVHQKGREHRRRMRHAEAASAALQAENARLKACCAALQFGDGGSGFSKIDPLGGD